jgi:HprK-related kinase B
MNYPYRISENHILKQLRENCPAEYRINLRFGDCRIEVAVSEKAIDQGLKAYFKPFADVPGKADIRISVHETSPEQLKFFDELDFQIKEPDPGKSKIKEEYADVEQYRIVRKRLTGMVFVFGRDIHVVAGPCLCNLNQVVNFINNRYIEWKLCRGCLLGHAAGVMFKGKGLALAGFSGAGKSTLALHLMNRGAVFVSNDRLMIEKNGKGLLMHGVAKLPRINPGTALNNPNLTDIVPTEDKARFSGLSGEELWQLEHKYDVPVDECFGAERFVLSAQMQGLVILNWQRGEGEILVREVDPSERQDLLPAFMKSVGLFFSPDEKCAMPEPTIKNYADYLSLCSVMEITGMTDFEAAADACVSFLGK